MVYCCRIFDQTVNTKIVLFTEKKTQPISSCGVAQSLAGTFNSSGWNINMLLVLIFNPKQ